nr:type II toxin-antitoxin system VapC family toxin [Thiocystis violacea]
MLDTNVLSEFTKPRVNPGLFDWMQHSDETRMAISVVSVGEIQKGLSRMSEGRRQTDLQAWLDQSLVPRFQQRILALDLNDMQRWGRMMGAAIKQGETRPALDTLLAAVALNRGLILVTRNTRDFERTGVNLLNPWT